MEIEAYLERIGAERPTAPSLEALSTLHQKHMYAVPFENVDMYRGVPMAMDEARFLDKVIRQRRGGICLEVNTTFAWLLRNLGYRVSIVSGEVANGPGSFGKAGHHLLLLVELGPDEPPRVVNVGYGNGSLYPLPLVADAITHDRQFQYRMVNTGDYWLVQWAPAGSDAFESQYRFTTTPRRIADFEEALVWCQTSPDSVWRKLNCARATPEGRIQLFGNRLIVSQGGKKTETWIRGEAAVNQALRRHFGLTLPAAPG